MNRQARAITRSSAEVAAVTRLLLVDDSEVFRERLARAFRERVKKFHPDARKGDRSSEPQLRRILEAYQLLKEYLSLSNMDPTTGVRGGFNPTE